MDFRCILFKGSDNAKVGKYRDENVVISGAEQIPPTNYEIADLMLKFIAEYENKWKGFYPVVRATLLH